MRTANRSWAYYNQLILLVGSGWLCACAGLPTIHNAKVNQEPCIAPFAQKPYRIIHRIDVQLPLHAMSAMLGITIVDPKQRRFRSVLTSIEGLTLFDATSTTDALIIHRALGPLSQEGFGEGLMRDVALMLFAPKEAPVQVGRYASGPWVCRFHEGSQVIDRIRVSAKQHTINLYQDGIRTRKVTHYFTQVNSPAQRTVLQAYGLVEYRLELTLLEFAFVQVSEKIFFPNG